MLLSALSMQIPENQSETRALIRDVLTRTRMKLFHPQCLTHAHTHTSTDLSYCSLIALRIKEDAKHKVKKKIMG